MRLLRWRLLILRVAEGKRISLGGESGTAQP